MKNIKVSILVPICNVEKFLRKCLQSLVSQTLEDIEIICINDGSKDKSLDIIQEFANRDNRIIVIDKPNSGYGDSMNKGLEIAKGEYIGIVESDDFADENMFKDLYELAKGNDADIVKSNYKLYWETPEKFEFYNSLNVNNIENDADNCREKLFWGTPAIWSAIYKRSWLLETGIKFLPTPGAAYQDTSFKFKTTALANKIVLTPKAYLNYRQDNVNSSVKIANKEKVMLLHKEYAEIKRFLLEINLGKYMKHYYTQMLLGYMWNYRRISDTLRDEYFNVMVDAIKDEGSEWCIYADKLPKHLKYVGYNAILNSNKGKLDLMIFLQKLKSKVLG